jgi:hypothetical protein
MPKKPVPTVPRITDEGLFLEIVDAVRLLKMAGQILETRPPGLDPNSQRKVLEAIVRFLNGVKSPLAAWAKADCKNWSDDSGGQPTADGCKRDGER